MLSRDPSARVRARHWCLVMSVFGRGEQCLRFVEQRGRGPLREQVTNVSTWRMGWARCLSLGRAARAWMPTLEHVLSRTTAFNSLRDTSKAQVALVFVSSDPTRRDEPARRVARHRVCACAPICPEPTSQHLRPCALERPPPRSQQSVARATSTDRQATKLLGLELRTHGAQTRLHVSCSRNARYTSSGQEAHARRLAVSLVSPKDECAQPN